MLARLPSSVLPAQIRAYPRRRRGNALRSAVGDDDKGTRCRVRCRGRPSEPTSSAASPRHPPPSTSTASRPPNPSTRARVMPTTTSRTTTPPPPPGALALDRSPRPRWRLQDLARVRVRQPPHGWDGHRETYEAAAGSTLRVYGTPAHRYDVRVKLTPQGANGFSPLATTQHSTALEALRCGREQRQPSSSRHPPSTRHLQLANSNDRAPRFARPQQPRPQQPRPG
ncbi:hypothetical protein BJ912DRAFT_643278 [Pholiota molesta]|nr:hypothetical protein BJ912DRAFT_643278 [Pholiota molesta]